jgi:hypothetical protein
MADMNRFSADQFAYAQSRTGYLGRPESIEFLKRMDIKMSVGHWSAGETTPKLQLPTPKRSRSGEQGERRHVVYPNVAIRSFGSWELDVGS